MENQCVAHEIFFAGKIQKVCGSKSQRSNIVTVRILFGLEIL